MTRLSAAVPIVLASLVLSLAAASAPAQEKQEALLRVKLPGPDTLLEVQGVPQKKKDTDVRLFKSPPLEPNKAYVYDLKATWTENGKTMTRERSVKVMAGRTTEIDLTLATDNSPDVVPPKPADRPPADKPADKPVEKPADKPADKPPVIEKPLEAPAGAAPPEVVEFMLNFAKVRDTDVVYDLGSGDGRVALAAASNFKARKAVALDSRTDWLAGAKKSAAALGDKIEFRTADPAKLTATDLADATVVIVDASLDKKLPELTEVLKKLKVGTRVVSHEFRLPGLKEDDKREQTVNMLDHMLYLYIIK